MEKKAEVSDHNSEDSNTDSSESSSEENYSSSETDEIAPEGMMYCVR